MIQTFFYPHGNILQVNHSEEVAIPSEAEIWDAIGMFFHYIQQQSGELFLNSTRIIPLSLAQTCGAAAAPCDYVGLDYPVTRVSLLKDLIKWPSAS